MWAKKSNYLLAVEKVELVLPIALTLTRYTAFYFRGNSFPNFRSNKSKSGSSIIIAYTLSMKIKAGFKSGVVTMDLKSNNSSVLVNVSEIFMLIICNDFDPKKVAILTKTFLAGKPVSCILRKSRSRLHMPEDSTCMMRKIIDIWIVSIMSPMVCACHNLIHIVVYKRIQCTNSQISYSMEALGIYHTPSFAFLLKSLTNHSIH